ncbi:RNA deprotection pyrophosphohydrolase [Staphylococcus canis]|uniref:Nucleoside triphosphatase YtkD n=1 Tax=Staphylococcus canis TaxID=2724942 RepID=A0ABS0TD86_9STAP|nr:nucleoside triphosphatase YtkD [Staphylococcus canis]
MNFIDAHQQSVELTFKSNGDQRDGDHVLALPIFKNQLLFTQHRKRGIEFPGGKNEAEETSEQALKRELYEETGARFQYAYYIAQYDVQGLTHSFRKDVYVVIVDEIEQKVDYLETNGPILFDSIEAIPDSKKSFLLKDKAILKCVERMMELGFYQQ